MLHLLRVVNYSKLLFKLESYRRPYLWLTIKWTKCFLIDSLQKVRVGSCLSIVESVSSGVPQASVLGPVL